MIYLPTRKRKGQEMQVNLTRKLNECASLLLLSYVGLPILVGPMTIIYTYVASFTRHVISVCQLDLLSQLGPLKQWHLIVRYNYL